MIKKFVIRFSLLILSLFFILSGVWVFRDVVFALVVILVLVVVAVLCILILLDPIRLELLAKDELGEELRKEDQEIKQLEEKKHILEEEHESIYEEKEKLEYVLANIKDGVIFLNRERRIVLLNKAAEEIIGKSRADASGKQMGEIFKLIDETREMQADEYLLDDTFLKKRIRLESASTTSKLVDFACVRLALIRMQNLGYMIVLHDLSEELEVERQEDALLSRFASELKSSLELGGVLQLNILMENLLTFNLLTSGKVDVSDEVVDLTALLEELVRVVSPLISERQLSLEIDNKKDLEARVHGGKAQIRQIVLNLLMNAIKYTKSGGKITVSLSSTDGTIVLHIQDTGIGISGEDMQHLFEKFFAGENVDLDVRGIGLGLYVSKRLADLMNVKMWLDSVEGRGTVASVSFSRLQ